jgi:hypothetical protein
MAAAVESSHLLLFISARDLYTVAALDVGQHALLRLVQRLWVQHDRAALLQVAEAAGVQLLVQKPFASLAGTPQTGRAIPHAPAAAAAPAAVAPPFRNIHVPHELIARSRYAQAAAPRGGLHRTDPLVVDVEPEDEIASWTTEQLRQWKATTQTGSDRQTANCLFGMHKETASLEAYSDALLEAGATLDRRLPLRDHAVDSGNGRLHVHLCGRPDAVLVRRSDGDCAPQRVALDAKNRTTLTAAQSEATMAARDYIQLQAYAVLFGCDETVLLDCCWPDDHRPHLREQWATFDGALWAWLEERLVVFARTLYDVLVRGTSEQRKALVLLDDRGLRAHFAAAFDRQCTVEAGPLARLLDDESHGREVAPVLPSLTRPPCRSRIVTTPEPATLGKGTADSPIDLMDE